MVKVTYSLDDATVRRIRRAAERLGRPQSQVVREAVAEYDARTDRLSEAERLRMLEVLDRLRSEPVTRSRAALAAELGRCVGPAARQSGHRVQLSTIVLYEWLRGPRTINELRVQEEIFPRAQAAPFDTDAAGQAAALYAQLTRPRGRDLDLAVAACALVHDAALWTLNHKDFSDVPGLKLV